MCIDGINGACILKNGNMMQLRAPPPPAQTRMNKSRSLRISWVATLRIPTRSTIPGSTSRFPIFATCTIPTARVTLGSMSTCPLPRPSLSVCRRWRMSMPLFNTYTRIATLATQFMILTPSSRHSLLPMLTKTSLPVPPIMQEWKAQPLSQA